MIHSGTNSPAAETAGLLFPEGIICPVVSVSLYYFAAGLLIPEGIIRPVVGVSV
jgi:hypothetical protein